MVYFVKGDEETVKKNGKDLRKVKSLMRKGKEMTINMTTQTEEERWD